MNISSFQTGFRLILEIPRIAASGEFTIGVNPTPPIPPRLEILKLAPSISVVFSLPFLAALPRASSSDAISDIPRLSAFLSTGMTSPFSVLTAIPIL